MTYTSETHESREFSLGASESRVLRFYIDGTYSEDEAEEEARLIAPEIYRGLFRQTCRATCQNDAWEIEVTYGPGQSKTNEPWFHEWHLRVGSQQVHQTHSLATVNVYVPSGAEKTKTYNAIGISDDGGTLRVDGVDTDVSTFDWSETLQVPKPHFNAAYVNNLFVQRGRVASHQFRGPGNLVFESGEVLCADISAEPNGADYVSVHFDFSASPNAKNLSIGGITGIQKYGWDYLWVWWANYLDGDQLTKRAKQVNVERIKQPGNFWSFGLPRWFS